MFLISAYRRSLANRRTAQKVCQKIGAGHLASLILELSQPLAGYLYIMYNAIKTNFKIVHTEFRFDDLMLEKSLLST